ncbi:MAG: PilZ domain-containing protein, partial [Lachnospiraceae bacterium]|nr:PilZ domain-containing protein [Lachnospiraceae bacterium]
TVDSAVKEVEASNKILTDNMKQVCDLMEVMTERIDRAEFTTKEMLSKYEESAKNAGSIEAVVGQLMEELGVGGFMGVQDVREGMKISVVLKDAGAGRGEFIGEVVACEDKNLYVVMEDDGKDAFDKKEKHTLCQLRIVVDNILYCWEDIELSFAANDKRGKYMLTVETNPQVFNRRKYPRMPLTNTCFIKVKGDEHSYLGRMVNISANGFAFASREELFANVKGKDVIVDVNDLRILNNKPLEGCIIRSSNNDGEYVVGCRMPQDSEVIKEYVSKNFSE